MRRKIWAITLVLTLVLCQTALAESIVGVWTGTVSAMGFKYKANAVFTADERFDFAFSSYAAKGAYALAGKRIHLTPDGDVRHTLNWAIDKSGVLTISGRLSIAEFENVPVKLVATKEVAKVTKVKCPKVAYGKESKLTVTTNAQAQCVKVTDLLGRTLDMTAEKSGQNTFVLKHTFTDVSTKVNVYAGVGMGDDVVWGAKKAVVVKVGEPAAATKLVSVKADLKKVRVGKPVTLTVTANNKTTRVKVVGAETVVSDKYVVKGKNRVFTVAYTQATARKQTLKVHAGDDYGFKTTAKTVVVTFRKK